MGLCQNQRKLCLWLQTYYTHSKFNLNDIIIMIFFINPVDIYIFTFILWNTKI